MSAKITYIVEGRCDLDEWHWLDEVEAVTEDEAIEEYRRKHPGMRGTELRADEAA
jgi:hypothetical protein